MNNSHLGYLPLSLITLILKHKKQSEFRTFLILKYQNPKLAFYSCQKEAYLECEDELHYSFKTFTRHLTKLYKLGYISLDKNGGIYIRGYEYLFIALELEHNRRKVELSKAHLSKDNFKSYLNGVIVGELARRKRYNAIYGELKKDGLYQPSIAKKLLKRDNTFPLSARYLSKVLNIPSSTIHPYLMDARQKGYIGYKTNIEPLNLPYSCLKALRADYEEGNPYPVSYGGYLFLRHPDRYCPKLHTKRIKF